MTSPTICSLNNLTLMTDIDGRTWGWSPDATVRILDKQTLRDLYQQEIDKEVQNLITKADSFQLKSTGEHFRRKSFFGTRPNTSRARPVRSSSYYVKADSAADWEECTESDWEAGAIKARQEHRDELEDDLARLMDGVPPGACQVTVVLDGDRMQLASGSGLSDGSNVMTFWVDLAAKDGG